MEVYIEHVILDNLIINTIIICLTLKTLKLKVVKWRIFLSAFAGMAFAIVMPFITLNPYLMFLLKLTIGAGLCPIFITPKSIKQFFLIYIWFLTYTFVLGGLCFGIIYMLNINTTVNVILINGIDLPISIFLAPAGIFIYFLARSLKVVKAKANNAQYTYTLKILKDNHEYTLAGFLDSGNKLYHNGQPLIVLSLTTFAKIFKNIPPEKVFKQTVTSADLKNAHYKTIQSAIGENKLLVFNLDTAILMLDKKPKKLTNPGFALAVTNFNNEFDCLLHPELFN